MSVHRIVTSVIAGAVLLTAVNSTGFSRDKTEGYPPGYTATGPNGYVYVAPSYQAVPPYYPYGGIYLGGYAPPPVGFGGPYYNGYNDPYYGYYGPGVRQFLRYGGADFYGW
jgi:hypothetical protein